MRAISLYFAYEGHRLRGAPCSDECSDVLLQTI